VTWRRISDAWSAAHQTCSAKFIQLGRYDRALDFVPLDSGSEWSRLVTRWVYQRMGRRDDAREQHRQQSPGYPSGLAPASFHGFIARCLSSKLAHELMLVCTRRSSPLRATRSYP
jgi:hypothetical protein